MENLTLKFYDQYDNCTAQTSFQTYENKLTDIMEDVKEQIVGNEVPSTPQTYEYLTITSTKGSAIIEYTEVQDKEAELCQEEYDYHTKNDYNYDGNHNPI